MTPKGSFTASSAWILGRTQSTSADRLLQRVRAVANELEAIQNEMCAQLAASDGTPRKNAFTPDSATASEFHRFKTVVDQMRRTLWFYTGDATAAFKAGADSGEAIHAPTQKLQDQSGGSEIESGSFFERLNVVIDGYIQSGPDALSRRSKL